MQAKYYIFPRTYNYYLVKIESLYGILLIIKKKIKLILLKTSF